MTSANELASVLRGQGHRMTGPRLVVWSTLVEADGHLTADQVAEKARTADPTINLSSVYRSLSLFEEIGIARETKLGPGAAAHWEIAHPDDQFHLRCSNCGRVQHHTGTLVRQIEDHLASEHGFKPHNVDLVVSGLCDRCQ